MLHAEVHASMKPSLLQHFQLTLFPCFWRFVFHLLKPSLCIGSCVTDKWFPSIKFRHGSSGPSLWLVPGLPPGNITLWQLPPINRLIVILLIRHADDLSQWFFLCCNHDDDDDGWQTIHCYLLFSCFVALQIPYYWVMFFYCLTDLIGCNTKHSCTYTNLLFLSYTCTHTHTHTHKQRHKGLVWALVTIWASRWSAHRPCMSECQTLN